MDGKISNPAQVCCLRRYELTEGKERGLKVIDCDNGRIRFLLNESKALDMMQLYDRGVNLSFISKNGFTARELPFAKRFEVRTVAGVTAKKNAFLRRFNQIATPKGIVLSK